MKKIQIQFQTIPITIYMKNLNEKEFNKVKWQIVKNNLDPIMEECFRRYVESNSDENLEKSNAKRK